MANLSKRDAANIAISVLSAVRNSINVDSTYIGYAAAAGIGVTNTFPTTDPISSLTVTRASAAQMTSMVQSYTTLCARTLRLNFTRTGTWVLTAAISGNQGQAHYNNEVVKPRPGVVSVYYGYVPGFTPVAGQLVPAAPGYTIFANNQLASRTAFINLCNDLNVKIQAHRDNNALGIGYCHTNCHNNCHTSRGRR